MWLIESGDCVGFCKLGRMNECKFWWGEIENVIRLLKGNGV